MGEEALQALQGKKVLVTGGTGFTGRHLLRKLHAAGAVIHAIARPSSSRDGLEALPVQWFRGDVFDDGVTRAALKDCQIIFHVAAAYRDASLTRADYWRVHVESTRNLAQAALENPSFERFVHVSTIGVHGHIPNPPANEAEPMRPGDIYQETKAEAENWLRQFAQEHKLPVTVIRPSGIFGPGDRRLLKVFKMALKPFFPVLGFGPCLYHLIHVEDLTEAILLAAVRRQALGEVFICGNTECTSIPQIARIVASRAGRSLHVVRLPAWPFFAIGWVLEKICVPLHWTPPLYPRRVAFYTKNRSFDTRKLRDVLGFTPRYTNEEGICQTFDWYKEQGWL